VTAISTADLAAVVYSAGRVFDGLRTGRLDTENFLRSGSRDGITSRQDLALLEDLRDVAELIVGHGSAAIDADFVCRVNAAISRSGALHPGRLRTPDQRIGVSTRYGRHEPDPLTGRQLQHRIDAALNGADPQDCAIELFVDLAKAQPFEDGNKRTALFVANAYLIGLNTGALLTVPADDPQLRDAFNDLLAQAYVLDDRHGVSDLLRTHGFIPLKP
jgi:prophage maintenance system killer protein